MEAKRLRPSASKAPPKQSEVPSHGMTQRQVATALGWPLWKVKAVEKAALLKLRRSLLRLGITREMVLEVLEPHQRRPATPASELLKAAMLTEDDDDVPGMRID